MLRYHLYLAACVLLFPLGGGAAQESVSEVRFRTVGDKVHVFYDLTGKDKYEVALWLSDDGGRHFTIVPKALSGAIGSTVRPGQNKRIVWDVLRDVPRLEGDNFVFQVIARRPKNNATMWAIGLVGAGLVAGAAIYALQPKESDRSPEAPDPKDSGPDTGSITLEIPDPEDGGSDTGSITLEMPDPDDSGSDTGNITLEIPDPEGEEPPESGAGPDTGNITLEIPDPEGEEPPESGAESDTGDIILEIPDPEED